MKWPEEYSSELEKPWLKPWAQCGLPLAAKNLPWLGMVEKPAKNMVTLGMVFSWVYHIILCGCFIVLVWSFFWLSSLIVFCDYHLKTTTCNFIIIAEVKSFIIASTKDVFVHGSRNFKEVQESSSNEKTSWIYHMLIHVDVFQYVYQL